MTEQTVDVKCVATTTPIQREREAGVGGSYALWPRRKRRGRIRHHIARIRPSRI